MNARLLLLIGAALCIAQFFIPFISIDVLGVSKFSLSGLDYAQDTYSYYTTPPATGTAAKVSDFAYNQAYKWLTEMWDKSISLKQQAIVLGVMVVMAGPIFFLLFALGYLIRGLANKPYKRGVFFNILFLGFAWLMFYLLGKELPLLGNKLSFFHVAGIGYWVAFAGMWIAALSAFFEKEKVGEAAIQSAK